MTKKFTNSMFTFISHQTQMQYSYAVLKLPKIPAVDRNDRDQLLFLGKNGRRKQVKIPHHNQGSRLD